MWHVRRRVSDQGASAVEFALLVPLFMALVFGAVTGGLVLKSKLSLVSAAREASRFGATTPVEDYPTVDAWLRVVASVAIGAADGSLGTDLADADVPNRSICVALHTTAGWDVFRQPSGGSGPCFNDQRPVSEERVQIVVSRDDEWTFGFFPSLTVGLSGSAVSRYERPVAGP
jgi:hypothetical protein